MNDRQIEESWNDIDKDTYERSVKIFRSLKNLLKVNIKLHAEDQIQQGDIFLFNHFSRFETFIPQFLIYEETGAYTCAIASSEFFKGDSVLASYLNKVGVFPHNHAHLFPILCAQILRGRKVIIFPEGGMVKDRKVLDKHGRYSVFSRLTGQRRQHHTGPAVLAQGLEAFKATIRNTYSAKDFSQLQQWQQELKLDSMEQLLIAAIKPTLIVPANITFYPIRSSENMLSKGVELFADALSLRQTEELLIESNIVLKDTDMDLRMGTPIDPYSIWHWWNRYLLELNSSEFKSLDEVFKLHTSPKNCKQKLLGLYFKKNAIATRDQYMHEIYVNVTINLSHLASTLIMHLISKGQNQIEQQHFYSILYVTIKLLQKNNAICLHRSLLDPDEYGGLIEGICKRFDHFIFIAKTNDLLSDDEGSYQFLPKLCDQHEFDSIRMENIVAVYYNEAEPVKAVRDALNEALNLLRSKNVNLQHQLAYWQMDDEYRSLKSEQLHYSVAKYNDINQQETADTDPSPFLLQPEHPNGSGILLIHGLLASPAELRGYGEHLYNQGYTVLGVRLRGHGTSPYDLREQSWENWYASVQKGYTILSAFCERLLVTGFSTGGALAFKLAAEKQQIAAVIAINVPLDFVDTRFMLVPLLHGTNKLVNWISTFEGVKPFIANDPEHPRINYQNTPIRSLYELRRLVQEIETDLPNINIPTLLIYADEDPIVAYSSAKDMNEKICSQNKQLKTIKAKHHGILMDNTGNNWKIIDQFMDSLH